MAIQSSVALPSNFSTSIVTMNMTLVNTVLANNFNMTGTVPIAGSSFASTTATTTGPACSACSTTINGFFGGAGASRALCPIRLLMVELQRNNPHRRSCLRNKLSLFCFSPHRLNAEPCRAIAGTRQGPAGISLCLPNIVKNTRAMHMPGFCWAPAIIKPTNWKMHCRRWSVRFP